MATRKVFKVNDVIAVVKPIEERPNSDAASTRQPSVVLIFGWMDAKFNTLLKYSQAYDKLFPHATHIIVQQNVWGLWLPRRYREPEIAPLVQVLADAGVDWNNPAASRGLLVHTFSNGGCWRLVLLRQVLHKLGYQNQTGQLPPTAMIFDSCPGRTTFRRAHRAVVSSISSWILKLLFTIFFAPSYFARWLFDQVFRRGDKKNHIGVVWDRVALADVLPWARKTTPRAYLYSREDVMVPAEDVEEHVARLRADGFANVRAERFDRSAHVAHVRTDPEKYWAVVRETWNAAYESQEHAKA